MRFKPWTLKTLHNLYLFNVHFQLSLAGKKTNQAEKFVLENVHEIDIKMSRKPSQLPGVYFACADWLKLWRVICSNTARGKSASKYSCKNLFIQCARRPGPAKVSLREKGTFVE